MILTINQLNLPGEATLDPTIEFNRPLSEHWQQPKAILLTGATGFLGAYLLDELLHQTTADIYCLVRCSDGNAGKERLKKHLQFYLLWNEDFAHRIIPIVGDLSQPLLSLSEQEFDYLATHIDIIYHNGAFVNASRPYSTLKAVNVLGTQEILRLASLKQTKPVHFISTIAVLFSSAYAQAVKITETDLPDLSTLKGGYKQSKAVAEQLVTIAQKRGLPASIYRCARMLGHSKTGIMGNFQDLLSRMLKTCIQLGQFPEIEMEPDIVPVDYVSQAIIYLSKQEAYLGKAFHFLNNQQMTWQSLMAEIGSFGYSLEAVTYDEWLAKLKKNVKTDPIYASLWLMVSTANQLFPLNDQLDDSYTRQCLTKPSIVCPPVDKKLLYTYLNYFQKSGYIKFG
ncbi:MAG: NAD-dependent epimerase/dehydratase family protein [Symploca sp. SIO3E6]|nr:NAD-dependent epimerase/dehydratase family protein [Caldora sp. SIO3E6]